MGSEATKQTIVNNIMDELQNIHYTQASTGILYNPIFDLGDLITIKADGVLIKEDTNVLITTINYNYNGSSTLESVGSNRLLIDYSNDKTTSDSSTISQLKYNGTYISVFEGLQSYTINSTNKTITSIDYCIGSSDKVTLNGACQIDVTTAGTFEISYYLNGEKDIFETKQLLTVGSHTLNFSCWFDITEDLQNMYNTFEIKWYDFVSYQLSSIHMEIYYILDVKNYDKFYIYIEKDPRTFYTRFINESDLENIEKIRQYSYEEKSTSSNTKIFDFKNIENDYLAIKIKNEYSQKNKVFLGGITKIYDFKPDDSVEIEKGEKALIQYSHEYGSCFLVSSNENIKIFDSSVDSKEFSDLIITSRSEENNKLVYVDSFNEKIKVKFFMAEFPYYAKTKLKLYCNNDIKSYLDKYGPDSLFMRMSSESSAFIFNVFYKS
jgi:hypothetical protein